MTTKLWWDLNLFYKEDYSLETDETTWENVITISPSVYDDDGPMHHYTDIVFKTTFAEARYISSVRPIEQWGDDWFEDLESFLEVAPPRIASLLKALPDVNEYYQSLAS